MCKFSVFSAFIIFDCICCLFLAYYDDDDNTSMKVVTRKALRYISNHY